MYSHSGRIHSRRSNVVIEEWTCMLRQIFAKRHATRHARTGCEASGSEAGSFCTQVIVWVFGGRRSIGIAISIPIVTPKAFRKAKSYDITGYAIQNVRFDAARSGTVRIILPGAIAAVGTCLFDSFTNGSKLELVVGIHICSVDFIRDAVIDTS